MDSLSILPLCRLIRNQNIEKLRNECDKMKQTLRLSWEEVDSQERRK